MKIIILSILILSINLQNSAASDMGQSLFNKLANKTAAKKPAEKQQIMMASQGRNFPGINLMQKKCRVRTGRKNTNWSWTSNHAFVNGSGTRNVWYYVPFSPSFPWGVKPKVEVSLYRIDSTKDRNLRITASVVWKSYYGFVVKITTWADTKIYGAGYTYTAHHGCE